MADVGRPLKFKSVEELDTKINEYFDLCEEKKEKPLITGLAIHLDTSRKVLCEYSEKDEFSNSIKKAKSKCELCLERNLVEGKVNPTGSIFNLKNNYGWHDKIETEHSGEIKQDITLPAGIEDLIADSVSKIKDKI